MDPLYQQLGIAGVLVAVLVGGIDRIPVWPYRANADQACTTVAFGVAPP